MSFRYCGKYNFFFSYEIVLRIKRIIGAVKKKTKERNNAEQNGHSAVYEESHVSGQKAVLQADEVLDVDKRRRIQFPLDLHDFITRMDIRVCLSFVRRYTFREYNPRVRSMVRRLHSITISAIFSDLISLNSHFAHNYQQ